MDHGSAMSEQQAKSLELWCHGGYAPHPDRVIILRQQARRAQRATLSLLCAGFLRGGAWRLARSLPPSRLRDWAATGFTAHIEQAVQVGRHLADVARDENDQLYKLAARVWTAERARTSACLTQETLTEAMAQAEAAVLMALRGYGWSPDDEPQALAANSWSLARSSASSLAHAPAPELPSLGLLRLSCLNLAARRRAPTPAERELMSALEAREMGFEADSVGRPRAAGAKRRL